jgi:UDP-2,3-diacylglucosamine hydrolase
MPNEAVYFLSDAHFRSKDSSGEAEKLRRFATFIDSIEGAKHLYLLGDLFDFWLEYRRVIPKGYLEVLRPLRRLRDSGTAITLVGGNHDYWMGSFFTDELGATLALDGCRAEHQGKRLLMVHGDDLLNGDRGYKILKSIIRNRLFVGTAKLLHPDFTYWAADVLSGTSRKLGEAGHQKITPSRSLRLKPLLDETVDILIFGHLHMAFHQLHESWEMVCLGDWIELFSYGELRDGRMRLLNDQGKVFEPETI